MGGGGPPRTAASFYSANMCIYNFEARDLEIPNIYNLFREIFKFREDKSNNVVREIRKCFRKTAKFEFFAKQIIYISNLQITRFKMIYNMFVF